MWVSRVRVNGGFLSGLDVPFVRGLNVVIGPRGVGKTTLLELLRHALGAEHADRQRKKQREAFLTAVLGAGEVIVDLESHSGASQIIVDAKGRGRDDDLSQSILVLGQSELEDIASDAANRLALLDLRAGEDGATPSREDIARLTRAMYEVRNLLRQCEDESQKRPGLEADREIYRSQEESLIGSAEGQIRERRNQLRDIEKRSSDVTRRIESLRRGAQIASELQADMTSARQRTDRLVTLDREFLAGTEQTSESVEDVDRKLASLHASVKQLGAELSEKVQIARESESKLREEAAPLREELEEAEAGLGQLTAQIRNLDAQLSELDDNDVRMASLRVELERLKLSRDDAFAQVEAEEERVYRARREVAEATSRQINNQILVVVEHLADATDLSELLTDLLRGTHTRSTLIESLAARVLPRMLLDLAESRDIEGLASAGNLTTEQSARVIGVLDSAEALERLARIGLRDRVDFLLRDGGAEKSVDVLSTGQKCAVTLPIVLSERERTLVLDQPEDHLDNAYLVDHVVTAMVRRSSASIQTIVATHNANIPVLGSAGQVLVLASDGRKGAVRIEGSFDSPPVVSAITSIMEGGPAAFERRAKFYEDNGGLLDART